MSMMVLQIRSFFPSFGDLVCISLIKAVLLSGSMQANLGPVYQSRIIALPSWNFCTHSCISHSFQTNRKETALHYFRKVEFKVSCSLADWFPWAELPDGADVFCWHFSLTWHHCVHWICSTLFLYSTTTLSWDFPGYWRWVYKCSNDPLTSLAQE